MNFTPLLFFWLELIERNIANTNLIAWSWVNSTEIMVVKTHGLILGDQKWPPYRLISYSWNICSSILTIVILDWVTFTITWRRRSVSDIFHVYNGVEHNSNAIQLHFYNVLFEKWWQTGWWIMMICEWQTSAALKLPTYMCSTVDRNHSDYELNKTLQNNKLIGFLVISILLIMPLVSLSFQVL